MSCKYKWKYCSYIGTVKFLQDLSQYLCINLLGIPSFVVVKEAIKRYANYIISLTEKFIYTY